jgi:hypothetical protein
MGWRKPEYTKLGGNNLIYGPAAVGKTTSSIDSAPRPIGYYSLDPKKLEMTTRGNTSLKDVMISEPSGYEELWQDLTDNFEMLCTDFKTVLLDPISFFMNVTLLGEIEMETGAAKVFDSTKRPLVNMGRTDQTGYGALASIMSRLCRVTGNLSKRGVLVINVALEADNPKWNKMLAAGPAFAGREFPKNMPGFFDNIGRVESMMKDGRVIYPPKVYFQSDEENSWLSRWSGPALKSPFLPLDWELIMNYESGMDVKGELKRILTNRRKEQGNEV